MLTTYLEALVVMAAVYAGLMAFAWAVQQRTGNSGWVDTIWTYSLGLIGAGGALWPLGGAAPWPRQWLVAVLVAVWSLRLGTHIAIRTAGITDDPRYAQFAKDWGTNARLKMLVFLQNQALGSVPLVFAIFIAAHAPGTSLHWQDYAGALILMVGIGGEALSDAQLKRFRQDPANKGRVCDAGLWRFSRHPNYFFQWFGWLAYPMIAISLADPVLIHGDGLRCWLRFSCIGFWFTSPVSRLWKSKCSVHAVAPMPIIRRVPASFFLCLRIVEFQGNNRT